MKRLPILLSLLALVALSASIAYWVLQLYQPPQRPLAAAPVAVVPDPAIDAAASLFGGQMSAAAASNYQLTGVVAAGRESVAIIVADNGTPKALQVGKEVSAGVTVQEVHPRYVVLSDGGVLKRVEMAVDTHAGSAAPDTAPAQAQFQQPPQPPQPPQPQPQPQPQQPQPQPQQPAPNMMQGGPPPAAVPPAPPQVQMAPPTRSMSNGLPAPNQ